jgi:DNA-binding XRE family transcriptional regulator
MSPFNKGTLLFLLVIIILHFCSKCNNYVPKYVINIRVNFMYYTQRLKDLREDRDLTQEQVAKELNMKREQYRRYENGINEIKAKHIILFAQYYNVSTDYILGLTNNPQKNWTTKNNITINGGKNKINFK